MDFNQFWTPFADITWQQFGIGALMFLSGHLVLAYSHLFVALFSRLLGKNEPGAGLSLILVCIGQFLIVPWLTNSGSDALEKHAGLDALSASMLASVTYIAGVLHFCFLVSRRHSNSWSRPYLYYYLESRILLPFLLLFSIVIGLITMLRFIIIEEFIYAILKRIELANYERPYPRYIAKLYWHVGTAYLSASALIMGLPNHGKRIVNAFNCLRDHVTLEDDIVTKAEGVMTLHVRMKQTEERLDRIKVYVSYEQGERKELLNDELKLIEMMAYRLCAINHLDIPEPKE